MTKRRPRLVYKRPREVEESDSDHYGSDIDPEELRRFKDELLNDEAEMLPLKVDGALVRRIKKIETLDDEEEVKDEDEKEDADADPEEETKMEDEDLSALSPIDRLIREKEIRTATEERINAHLKAILFDPQTNVVRFGDLIKIASGQRVHRVVREGAQLMAIESAAEAFCNIAPGYLIRELTKEERGQKMKKDTRVVVAFEEALLMHYKHYIKTLDKFAKKLVKSKTDTTHEGTFTVELGMLCARCLSRLLGQLAHFNMAQDLITSLVRLSLTSYEPLIEVACDAISTLFHSDTTLERALHGTREISNCSKKMTVSPQLLYTLLSLNIKAVSKRKTEKALDALKNKKRKIHSERNKKAKKRDKQLKQVQEEIKTAEAAEDLSAKLRNATQIMEQLFATYFRIIKKTPHPSLLSPVLAGLSKFAHLINIDFFDDLFTAFEDLLAKHSLKTTDTLMCIRTVCSILSGEGVALNIDPLRFYRALYSLLPALPFQRNQERHNEEIRLLCECLDFMLNQRKKLVPFTRVVAFVKRLLLVGFLLPPRSVCAVLAVVRSHCLAHSRLTTLVDADDDMVTNGVFRPQTSDPDYCNALSTDFVAEIRKYEKYPNMVVCAYARNIKNKLPSSGAERLNPQWSTMKPADWLESEQVKGMDSPFWQSVSTFAKKQKIGSMDSQNIMTTLNAWITAKA